MPVINPVEDIRLAPLPTKDVDQAWLDSLPEQTKLEMRAGRRALMKSEEVTAEMDALTQKLAGEMFSKRAETELTSRRIKLDPRTRWKVEAVANIPDNRWDVKVTITHDKNPSVVFVEPFSQFPSDEMVAYLMMTG